MSRKNLPVVLTEAEIILILDNYGTHGHGRVRRWLARHPRFVRHFIPSSSSWLNLIERWFAELSEKAVRRGIFRSVEDYALRRRTSFGCLRRSLFRRTRAKRCAVP